MAEELSVIMPVHNERFLVREAIRRVLAVESPLIERLELIVVDDGSTDGTRELLRKLAAESPGAFRYLEHDENRGKGAAVRTGLAHATGSVTVINDADLEYDPQDLPRLMVPFVEQGADAVFGSRFLVSGYSRILYFRHSLANGLLTFLASLITDLNLSDMETCYKAVRTDLFKSIPIRSDDFRMEPELTIKLAKRRARVFEVPISYAGRTYAEGKKIRAKDAFLAVVAMLHWWLADDIYDPNRVGSTVLTDLTQIPRFNRWMADTLRSRLGARVLELGAGIGNLTREFIPRDLYTASDLDPDHLRYLKSFAEGTPYLEVRPLDPANEADFAPLKERYDTVLCINLLEQLTHPDRCLRNVRSALVPGGAVLVLVQRDSRFLSVPDSLAGKFRRYTPNSLRELLEAQGFKVCQVRDFNRIATPVWWFNSVVLRRGHFGRIQLKGFNLMTWLFRRLERALPWRGVSLIAVAERPAEGDSEAASDGAR